MSYLRQNNLCLAELLDLGGKQPRLRPIWMVLTLQGVVGNEIFTAWLGDVNYSF